VKRRDCTGRGSDGMFDFDRRADGSLSRIHCCRLGGRRCRGSGLRKGLSGDGGVGHGFG
jgi:hypothetical protein